MHINPVDRDFLVLNHSAKYWTGSGWLHPPEFAFNMNLEEASKRAVQTHGSTLLFSGMMIEIDHDTYRGKHCIWVDYPDYSQDRFLNEPAAIKSIENWIKKCPEPNA